MESSISLETQETFIPKEKVYPFDLIPALEYFSNRIEVISLDCFDTLLWRKTATPVDVFYDLQKKPAFQSIKLNPFLRIQLEGMARKYKFMQEKNTEVKLNEIYQAGFPTLTPLQLDLLAEEELTAEKEACYSFPPIVDLIRMAHAMGKKIIIVSNTYFDEKQLRSLLEHTLPQDAMNLISKIFCSCEHGVSKNNGLFNHVLNKMNHKPDSILHIGDDFHADLSAPRALGIHSLQLIQYDNNISELLRLQAASASIFNPSIRHTQSLEAPFRALFANVKIDKPEQMIGYASIGPLMYAFAEYIFNEIEQIKKSGKTPKILFLMRDAYLPSIICEILAGKPIGKCVRISRFAAYAASFRTKNDVDKYLAEFALSGRLNDIARQLLLPNEIIQPLIDVAAHSADPIAEFIHLIQRDDILNIIFKKSASYRQRFIKYLKNEINLKQGDTLMFIDLGYSGTAQRQLEPILRKELDVDIIGRYLIALNVPDWENSRRGLLDPSWCDDRAMLALVKYIAILEKICTSNEKSVIDYDSKGKPIFSESSISKNQDAKLDKIHAECIRFAKDAKQFFKAAGKLPIKTLRETALAELGRLIFLPTESEIQYLESFQFDLNMGTHDILQVFNSEQGLNSLRKRGLFFSFMENNQKSMRTNYPAELRSAGMELVMTIMTQSRFGIGLGYKDMSLRRQQIPVFVMQDNQIAKNTVEALLTYDGYYSLTLPIGNPGYQMGVVFGKLYRWLQLENAELILANTFLNNTESLYAEDVFPSLIFHDMKNHGGNLYECGSETSSVMIPPLKKDEDKLYLIRLIFRPVVSIPSA